VGRYAYKEIQDAGGEAIWIQADVTQEAQVEAMIQGMFLHQPIGRRKGRKSPTLS
jgi:hypothetical protein